MRLRALFYSHDTLGLGHLRRTLAICDGLGERFRDLSMLVLTGSEVAHGFRLPPGVDYVKLPCVSKIDNEQYRSRRLGVPFETTLALREELIFQSAVKYQPDLLFVDNVPLGMKGELARTLEHVREHMPGTHVILGLRDILDDSSHIVPLWRRLGVFEALEKYYDRIFVYGLPNVFDLVNEYQLPDHLRRKTSFFGYLPREVDRRAARAAHAALCPAGEKLVVVTVGGGADGAPLIESYLRALPEISRQVAVSSLVVLGPEMDSQKAQALAAAAPKARLKLVDFCDEMTTHLAAADAVVSMAGYNTVSEILWLRKRAVVVPRVRPRTEQLIRAQRLQGLSLAQMIHPADLTPARMAAEVLTALQAQRKPAAPALEFGAFDKIAAELRSILGHSHQTSLQGAVA